MNEAIREVVSTHIADDVKDPRIGFVTVTAVQTSLDLRNARVFFTVLGSATERQEALSGLRSSRGYLQARIGQDLRLKRTPMLDFAYDDSIDRGMRISELLAAEAIDDEALDPPTFEIGGDRFRSPTAARDRIEDGVGPGSGTGQ